MSDFKPTPETDLTTAQMMERYQLKDEATLRSWARLHAIDSDRDLYTPTEVDVIDHVHHHIHNLAMSIEDYQSMLERRRQSRYKEENEQKITENRSNANSEENTFYTIPEPVREVTEENENITNEVTEDASEAIEMLTEQYAEAIDLMGERIADRFIDELDLSVMRHLAQKVKDRRKLNGKSQPNRFLKTIQAVLPAKGRNFLVSRKSEEPSMELEQNHRLG
ncbi:MAG: hypothetical protein F6K35_48525 [Okeania sp. SIO2H7]|nr:hypothetical protein [Okeania sp. SIO2H7]